MTYRILDDGERQFFDSYLRDMGIEYGKQFDESALQTRDGWRRYDIEHGLGMPFKEFEFVVGIAQCFGDEEFIVAEPFSKPKNLRMCTCQLIYDDFMDLIYGDVDFVNLDTCVFGRSGKWLMLLGSYTYGWILYAPSATVRRKIVDGA